MAEKPTFKTLKKYDIRTGRYPLKVSVKIWDDGKSKPFIELYRGVPQKNKPYAHHNFKITDRNIWKKIRTVIDQDLVKRLKGKPISETLLERQIIEELKILKEDPLQFKKTLQAQPRFIKEYRTTQLPKYKKNLKELQLLLNKARREEELQKFLSEHPWLLGLEYETATPQKISVKSKYDFYVQKYDGYADIIEIKKPGDEIFNKAGKLSSAFGRALQQLIEYIDGAMYIGDSKKASKALDVSFLKPKGVLIIGRSEDEEKLRSLCHYFHNIEVLTYDDIHKRGETILKHLEKQTHAKAKAKTN